MKACVLAESADAQNLLCAGARTLADQVELVVIGGTPLTGVADVAYAIELPENTPADNASAALIALYDEVQPDIVLIEPTPRLKIVGGLLAAHAGTSIVNDVVSFEGYTASSMYFGGLATKKQRATGSVKFYSTTGVPFNDMSAHGSDEVRSVAYREPAHPLVLRATKPVEQSGADLGRAKVVVGVGRGFAEESDLEFARNLAAKTKGELACTRPIAENNKWLPRSVYLGVSGRMIAPKVYFALGISGQMQHMIGVHNADIVIAINKDQNAPVFNQADYGLVGDIRTVLPKLVDAL